MPANLTLTSPDSPIELELDGRGLPLALALDHTRRELRSRLAVTTGGTETRGATGGLSYLDTATCDDLSVTGETNRVHRGTFDEFALPGRLGELDVVLYQGWLVKK
ncbi:hypothetical protein [Aestuariimicrobium ganziense]|uniref:hypothetical protein n=1 Tax=Aestuariimicrobium ganziense TaxID=2773677 RepID=UPI001944159E|nr:hypothetical protein [Aestuariimicrobium ganziense]